jgi:hypothetical protein
MLGLVGIMATCAGGLLSYFIKSRCYVIKCCGAACYRDVVDIETSDASIITSNI